MTCLRGRVGSPGVTPGHAVDSTWCCTKLRDQEFRAGAGVPATRGAAAECTARSAPRGWTGVASGPWAPVGQPRRGATERVGLCLLSGAGLWSGGADRGCARRGAGPGRGAAADHRQSGSQLGALGWQSGGAVWGDARQAVGGLRGGPCEECASQAF